VTRGNLSKIEKRNKRYKRANDLCHTDKTAGVNPSEELLARAFLLWSVTSQPLSLGQNESLSGEHGRPSNTQLNWSPVRL
jgi:hypothetical protein